MLVLGIETTCDETSAAVVERAADGSGTIRSNVVVSQLDQHKDFGGVVPEIAARAHVELTDTIVRRAMEEAKVRFSELDVVAAAAGPGLIGGVIVGLTTGKAIALASSKPLLAINHLEAHALTARLTSRVEFPYLLLLISGGHTQLVSVEDVGRYTLIGTTVDDALGEAFDKTAKMLGLPYPGGPEVERCAAAGDATRFNLPRPMLGRREPNFSLSGLKTAIRLEAERVAPLNLKTINDLCAGFQAAITDVLADRVKVALEQLKFSNWRPRALVVAGGVAANKSIRRALENLAQKTSTRLVIPPPELCTDNGAMIAWAGAERFARGFVDGLDASPRARWPLSTTPARATV
jgi:N6-L-threonylcarbamoyladenine synthase